MHINPSEFITLTVHISELPLEVFDDDSLLTPAQTAAILGCSEHKLVKDRQLGRGLKPVYLAKESRPRYRRGDVRQLVKERLEA